MAGGPSKKKPKLRWIGLSDSQKKRATKEYRKLKREGLSDSYAKRVAKGVAKGRTRQQARGHKEKEHVERKEREIAERGITGAQEKSVRKWYDKTPQVKGADEDELVEHVRSFGFDWFSNLKKEQKRLHKAWEKAGRPKRLLDSSEWTRMLNEINPPDDKLLFYH